MEDRRKELKVGIVTYDLRKKGRWKEISVRINFCFPHDLYD